MLEQKWLEPKWLRRRRRRRRRSRSKRRRRRRRKRRRRRRRIFAFGCQLTGFAQVNPAR